MKVKNINDPPIIISKPITKGYVFIPYIYNVKAKDPDNDRLKFSLIEFPDRMRISSRKGKIVWIPSTPGIYPVIVEVSDGEFQDIQYFELNISSLWEIKTKLFKVFDDFSFIQLYNRI